MIGATICGFRIQEKLGEGGVGEVYRALDVSLDREVAVKVLRAELAQREEVRERFRVEAKTLASLYHRNIAGIYAFHGQGAVQMMVMELVSGCNLEQHLTRTSLGVRDAVDLVLQAARGLSYAHGRSIIHRDLKPANLMIDDAGQLKITDFGIARIVGADRLTRQGAVIGTACYMAPEQIRGEPAGARSDIYALAIVLYELLAGHPPFGGDSDYDILRSQVGRRPPPLRLCRPDIPRTVERFLARALQKKPEDRHRSMDEVIAELSAVREDCLAAAIADCSRPSSSPHAAIRTPSAARFRKPLAVLAVASALMVAAGGVVWISPAATSPEAATESRSEPFSQPAPSALEDAPSAQPDSASRQVIPRQAEPARSTPEAESHSDEPEQQAEASRPQPPPSALPPIEPSAPTTPEPVVQGPPGPGPATLPEPGPASQPDLPPTSGSSNPGAGQPLAGPAFVRKAAQRCASAWSVNWHAAPSKSCTR